MAVNFNVGGVFNLKPIPLKTIKEEVEGLLIDDEKCVSAFKTIRDKLIFMNKRIISIDVQGISGKRKSFSSLPYSKIQFFTVQTPGFMEIIPNAELYLGFSNGMIATYVFEGDVDIGRISRLISEFLL